MFLNEKKEYQIQINKKFGLNLSLWPSTAQICSRHIYHICVDILCIMDILCIKNETKSGYSRMVKFLFAKEKTRVRFPLSAQNELIYLIS